MVALVSGSRYTGYISLPGLAGNLPRGIPNFENRITMQLTNIIIDKIKKEGPVSFHDFMEMCLYYPGLGYYTSAHTTIGKNGDYYTSAYLTPVFGAMIGRQLEEMWTVLGKKEFTVVEYGAGTGMLCHDILDYLKNNKKLYDQLHYCIIEKSPAMQKIEKEHLLTDGSLGRKVNWYDSIQQIPNVTGCILSNELVDNFSVHQVVMEDELMEVYVDYDDGFVEVLQPAGEALTNYLNELDVHLPKGFRTEINLEATQWIKEMAGCLKKGYIITIDYGHSSSELYCHRRQQGTLICYNKHTINDCPYQNIGQQDITSHVNFSALEHWGRKNGLNNCGCTNQANFLLGLGLDNHLKKIREQAQDDGYINYKKYAFLKYTLLIDMGTKYKVLVQQKEAPVHELSGLKLSNTLSAIKHASDAVMEA